MIKKLIAKIVLLAVLAISLSASAQTNTTATNTVTNQTAIVTGTTVTSVLGTIYNDAKNSGVFTATNYAFEPYGTYSPSAPKGHQAGGGALIIYNVNSYAGLAFGADYLGKFSLVSGNATLKYPISVGKYLPFTNSFMSSIKFVPFALAGIGTPTSGANGSGVTVIEDLGAVVEVGHWMGGKFNFGGCYGQWNNAGDYSGKRYHMFLGWSKGF